MFYRCEKCNGTLAGLNMTGPLSCCNQPLKALKAKRADDEHLLLSDCLGDRVTVSVGQDPHPMNEGHKILFIALQTKDRLLIKKTGAYRRANAVFHGVSGEFKVYAFCSEHGLFCDRVKSV